MSQNGSYRQQYPQTNGQHMAEQPKPQNPENDYPKQTIPLYGDIMGSATKASGINRKSYNTIYLAYLTAVGLTIIFKSYT